MPPELQDDNSEVSSTETEVHDSTDVEAQSSSVEGAESEAEADAERSLLNIVQEESKATREDSIEDDEEPPTSEAQEKADDADVSDEDEHEDDPTHDEFTSEELKALKGKTKKRIDTLLAQRNELQKASDEHGIITGFMKENNISSDDLSNVMGAMAHYKAGDYKGFLDVIQPLMDHAGEAVGAIIPDDLQKRVDDGYIDDDAAAELAQQRATIAFQQEQAQRTDFNRQAADKGVAADGMRGTVNEWEADVRGKDADYAMKEPQIKANARALMAEFGSPINAEQALQLAKDAYAMTNDFVKQARPAPQQIDRRPDSSLSSSNTQAQPKSMLDAVRMGIRNAHSGG